MVSRDGDPRDISSRNLRRTAGGSGQRTACAKRVPKQLHQYSCGGWLISQACVGLAGGAAAKKRGGYKEHMDHKIFVPHLHRRLSHSYLRSCLREVSLRLWDLMMVTFDRTTPG